MNDLLTLQNVVIFIDISKFQLYNSNFPLPATLFLLLWGDPEPTIFHSHQGQYHSGKWEDSNQHQSLKPCEPLNFIINDYWQDHDSISIHDDSLIGIWECGYLNAACISSRNKILTGILTRLKLYLKNVADRIAIITKPTKPLIISSQTGLLSHNQSQSRTHTSSLLSHNWSREEDWGRMRNTFPE